LTPNKHGRDEETTGKRKSQMMVLMSEGKIIAPARSDKTSKSRALCRGYHVSIGAKAIKTYEPTCFESRKKRPHERRKRKKEKVSSIGLLWKFAAVQRLAD